MKYYYTDPLAAAWMAEKFGMYLNDGIGSRRTIMHEYDEVGTEKFYVDPDSLRLLEPVVGDIVLMPDTHERIAIIEDISSAVPNIFSDIRGCHDIERISKIIQRGDIPFMWPEVEK